MVLMNEMQMLEKIKLSLTSYTTWTRSIIDKSGGGVATAVSPQFRELAIGV